jgi:CheY-like chemotaxis protein
MPGDDSYSLMTRIRALGIDEGGATPAVALTTHDRAQDSAQATAIGYHLHVTKPVDPMALTSMVKALCGQVARHDAV